MRAGFNWELGPFQMWDAAGVKETVTRMKAMNLPVPPAARRSRAVSFAVLGSALGVRPPYL